MSIPLISHCTFEIDIKRNKEKYLLQALNVRFSCEKKTQRDDCNIYKLSICNPSREEINTLVDLIEGRLKTDYPEFENDEADRQNCQKDVGIMADVKSDASLVFDQRDAGTTDGSHKSICRSEEGRKIIAVKKSHDCREYRTFENDFGQAEELKCYGHNSGEEINTEKEHSLYSTKDNEISSYDDASPHVCNSIKETFVRTSLKLQEEKRPGNEEAMDQDQDIQEPVSHPVPNKHWVKRTVSTCQPVDEEKIPTNLGSKGRSIKSMPVTARNDLKFDEIHSDANIYNGKDSQNFKTDRDDLENNLYRESNLDENRKKSPNSLGANILPKRNERVSAGDGSENKEVRSKDKIEKDRASTSRGQKGSSNVVGNNELERSAEMCYLKENGEDDDNKEDLSRTSHMGIWNNAVDTFNNDDRLKQNSEYVNEDVGDDDEEEYVSTTFPFSKLEYDFAKKYFQRNDPSVENYLKDCFPQDLSYLVKIDDEEIVKKLNAFCKKLKRERIPLQNDELFEKVKRRWAKEFVTEEAKDYFTLITLEHTLNEIRKEYPNIFTVSFGKDSSNYKEDTMVLKTDSRNASVSHISDEEEGRKKDRDGMFRGHKSALTVQVHKADITKLNVDVIVNAANRHLQHGGGVARAIADAAGFKLKDDCKRHISTRGPVEVAHHFASIGGNLKAREVFHAVGPKWNHYSDKPDACKRDLRMTILRCLIDAEKKGHHSIAFPSISAAIFGVPKEICVESYMKAVRHFEELRNTKSLKTVHFVDIDDNMVNTIKEHFKSCWNINLSKKDTEFKHDKKFIAEFRESENTFRRSEDTDKFKSSPKSTGAYTNSNRPSHNAIYSAIAGQGWPIRDDDSKSTKLRDPGEKLLSGFQGSSVKDCSPRNAKRAKGKDSSREDARSGSMPANLSKYETSEGKRQTEDSKLNYAGAGSAPNQSET